MKTSELIKLDELLLDVEKINDDIEELKDKIAELEEGIMYPGSDFSLDRSMLIYNEKDGQFSLDKTKIAIKNAIHTRAANSQQRDSVADFVIEKLESIDKYNKKIAMLKEKRESKLIRADKITRKVQKIQDIEVREALKLFHLKGLTTFAQVGRELNVDGTWLRRKIKRVTCQQYINYVKNRRFIQKKF